MSLKSLTVYPLPCVLRLPAVRVATLTSWPFGGRCRTPLPVLRSCAVVRYAVGIGARCRDAPCRLAVSSVRVCHFAQTG